MSLSLRIACLCLPGFLLGCLHQVNDQREFIAREIISPQRHTAMVQLLASSGYPNNLNGLLQEFSEQEVLLAMRSNNFDGPPRREFVFGQSVEASPEDYELQLRPGQSLTRRAFAAAITGHSSEPVYVESCLRIPKEESWKPLPPWRKLR